MTCIIIDDEPAAVGVLELIIKKIPYLKVLGSFTNPIEGMESVRQLLPDITFLDIQMEAMSGVEVAKLIKDQTKIIFTTAYSDYAVSAFEDNALDYLMKPISLERLIKAIQKVPSTSIKNSALEDYMFIKNDIKGKVVKVQLDEVVYIEGYGNYVKFHRETDYLMALLTFKELTERLSPTDFKRIHKSYIVAINRIIGIEGNEALMRQKPKEIRIPIGTTYREDLLATIKPHIVGGK